MVELTLEKALLIAISLTIAVFVGLNIIIPLIDAIKNMLG